MSAISRERGERLARVRAPASGGPSRRGRSRRACAHISSRSAAGRRRARVMRVAKSPPSMREVDVVRLAQPRRRNAAPCGAAPRRNRRSAAGASCLQRSRARRPDRRGLARRARRRRRSGRARAPRGSRARRRAPRGSPARARRSSGSSPVSVEQPHRARRARPASRPARAARAPCGIARFVSARAHCLSSASHEGGVPRGKKGAGCRGQRTQPEAVLRSAARARLS